jgi:hypothetical protein
MVEVIEHIYDMTNTATKDNKDNCYNLLLHCMELSIVPFSVIIIRQNLYHRHWSRLTPAASKRRAPACSACHPHQLSIQHSCAACRRQAVAGLVPVRVAFSPLSRPGTRPPCRQPVRSRVRSFKRRGYGPGRDSPRFHLRAPSCQSLSRAAIGWLYGRGRRFRPSAPRTLKGISSLALCLHAPGRGRRGRYAPLPWACAPALRSPFSPRCTQ